MSGRETVRDANAPRAEDSFRQPDQELRGPQIRPGFRQRFPVETQIAMEIDSFRSIGTKTKRDPPGSGRRDALDREIADVPRACGQLGLDRLALMQAIELAAGKIDDDS